MVGLVGIALADVVGSKHDLGTGGGATGAATNVDRVCDFCHTPHMAAAANKQYPLWNHTLAGTANYGVYDSETLNASVANGGDIADIGGASVGTAAVSNLCMSCHDGSVGLGSLYNDPNIGTPDNSGTFISGNADLGTDLSDDHPVNFTYNTTLANNDGELENPATTPAVAALLIDDKVQCSSCHDPHDTTYNPFLTVDNSDSGLCTTCHIK
jgi:predicted CXXCH cytochrome family protein